MILRWNHFYLPEAEADMTQVVELVVTKPPSFKRSEANGGMTLD